MSNPASCAPHAGIPHLRRRIASLLLGGYTASLLTIQWRAIQNPTTGLP
ncbi:MAG: hypothetical protein ABI600_20040 [Luteolibacter sp.]